MKKILFTAVSALALASFADGVASTEFGAMYVPSTTPETIVSVPWLESDTGSNAVKVANLVLTAGLSNGDKLFLYDPSTKSYTKKWILTSGVWQHDQYTEQDATIPQGSALKLTRTADPIEKGFYIMGKPTEPGVTVTLGAGYSLIAPPSLADTDVNTGITWTGVDPKDKLMVPSSTVEGEFVTFSWADPESGDNRKWCEFDRTTRKWVAAKDKLKMGTGAWFVNSDKTSKIKTFKLK